MASLFSSLLGKAGKAIDTVGKKVGNILPEYNLSERLETRGSAALPVQQQVQKVQQDPRFLPANVAGPTKPSYPGVQAVPNQPSYQLNGTVNGLTTDIPGYAASSGGQGAGGNGGGGYGLTPPSPYNGTTEGEAADLQRRYFDEAKNGILGQDKILDETYKLSQEDINNGVTESEAAAQAQKQQNDSDFGKILKNQLGIYQDLGRQRQGAFSALGTLDSSAFGEQQFRADQSLAEQRGQTELENKKQNTGVDQAFQSYKSKAQTELGRLATQWQQGKNAIAAALAQNDLNGAQAIQSAVDQIRQRAQQVNDTIADFGNQVALLRGQGQDVKLNVAGMNANPYGQEVSKQLQGLQASGNSTYQIPTNQAQGQGFIAPNGKKYNSYSDYLRASAV